jgi:hypothetical protein
VNDRRLDVLWKVAAELQLPVAIHQGDPPAFFGPLDEANPRIEELRAHPDWWFGGGDFPRLDQIHEELEGLIAGQPETDFIAVHFGSFMPFPEVRRMLESYDNYYVDTAAAIADMGKGEACQLVRQIILDHPERVLFGTDLVRTGQFDIPVAMPGERWALNSFFDLHWRFFESGEPGLAHPIASQGAWTVTGLDLPQPILAKLYHANAQRLFRLPRRQKVADFRGLVRDGTRPEGEQSAVWRRAGMGRRTQ